MIIKQKSFIFLPLGSFKYFILGSLIKVYIKIFPWKITKFCYIVIEIFIILFTIPTFYSYNGKINVRGKLIDINGNPISDAQVKIYRNDVLIFQTETGNEGTFSFYVEREVVLVRFQAHGYEVKEIKLDLSSKTALTYWMGEIILDYSIKIVPGGNIFRTEQGEFLQIPVLIMNDGYEKETCLVEIKTPTDWRAQFVSSNGLRIEGFSEIDRS
ncbi:MAG: hypothetical protein B6U95_04625 [Thermofilum sp. ex4484_82]|nr:MAG: hypothetical protein B6U95_04625 [Thermofilum sp. ex4484_82]OYT38375.1 MAG: hypothetical protein B6U96_04620 [Archaeoglobales archaeon ex4484_92]